jgi:ABC-type transport system involved in multi-copper enzyme maturation permease subunit
MIFEFFRFELREQSRSPLLWLLAAAFALFALGVGSTDAVQMAGAGGNVLRNAPAVTATAMTFFTLPGMLVIAAAITAALLRDFEQGTAELLFAGPVRRCDYLAGRLSAAFLVCVLLYLLAGAGWLLAPCMPWADAASYGPASPWPLLWTLAVMVLPNLLFTGALLALLATLTRSVLWVYIGVLGLLVAYGVSAALLRDVDHVAIASLIEPLGIRALGRTLRYWSAAQRNADVPAIAGYLLANRALWLGGALAMLAATFALFRTGRGDASRGGTRTLAATPPPVAAAVPRVTPDFARGTAWRQFLRQLRFDTQGVFRSVPFMLMLVAGMANFIPTALMRESMYGTGIHPVTSQMLFALENSYSFLLVVVVLFYAGELVWKERAAKINEVTDAMPLPNRVPLLAKFATLVAVIASFQALGAVVAIGVQLAKGQPRIEPALYLETLALDSVLYVLMGGLALVFQVFANNKFAGYALLVLVMIGQGVLSSLDLTGNLYNFGSWANAPYSDMNGYGHFLPGQLWFQGYWGLCLAALLVLACAFWVRGVAIGRRRRWSLAGQRLRGRTGAAFAAAMLAFAGVGVFLYWNTNIRNSFLSPKQETDLQARYERDYKRYENLPQPKIVAASIDVDLHPESQSMRVEGRYRVRNVHASPIREVHVYMGERDAALVGFDAEGANLVTDDKPLGYRIYRLRQPLLPGTERDIAFQLDYHPNGIAAGQAQTQLVDNGSFFNNKLLPRFGYQQQIELTDRNERRQHGLGEPERMHPLEDVAARASTYLTDDADWIAFDTTICTAPDQTALAPGQLRETFTRAGRRCFSYAMQQPMQDFYAWLSARWQVKKASYTSVSGKPVAIEVYYDPKHPWNVERMIEASRASLAYDEANFSPYQFRQLRILEFPGYMRFAQSFANTIPYSESLGFIADLRDSDAIDYVYYVTAHEIAHQWWGHQVTAADVQGARMLSESLAQYSALMVMEHTYGRDRMQRFLRYELDDYLAGRGREELEELPLYRVENQPYIHYSKASLVFYRLREEIGEAALNRALRRFLAATAFGKPPYPTSLDLLSFIRAEAGPGQQALITDLFEKITFHDDRVVDASATRRSDGKYVVTLRLHAAKSHADGKGNETAVAVDDWMDVGVFARGPSGKEADRKVLYLQRHHITSENPTLSVVVDEVPYEAGIDPYNKLIDRVPSDNLRRVSFEGPG